MLNVSIVIPSMSEPRRLEATLISLLENRPEDCEILVLHSGHYDDPYDIADEVRLVEIPAAQSEEQLLSVGWSLCQAPIVHTLGPGATVSEGWLDEALARFDRPEVAAVIPQVTAANQTRGIFGVTADGLGLKTGGTTAGALGPMWQAAFYRRSILDAVGGFCSRLEEFADVDIALWIAQAGGQCPVVPECVVRLDRSLDLQRVTARRIRLAKTLQLRHQAWFAAQGKSTGKLSWLSRTVGSGSLAAVMSALTAGPDAKAATARLPDLDQLRDVLAGHEATIRFDPRHDRPTSPHRRAA